MKTLKTQYKSFESESRPRFRGKIQNAPFAAAAFALTGSFQLQG